MFVQKYYKEYKGVSAEVPARIDRILNYVHADAVGYEEKEAKDAIIRLHGKDYFYDVVSRIKKGEQTREDLYFEPSLYKVALNAVNTTLKAARNNTLAIIRPPGHHAGNRPEGFCYFNNVMIGVNELGKKAAIIDIDAHYGNGTHYFVENSDHLYVSMHSSLLYPPERYSRNGVLTEVIPANVDDKAFLEGWKKLLSHVKDFEPEIIAISAGFDTWYNDPVLGFNVRHYETYYKLGSMIKDLGIPFFGVLEGGYSPQLGRIFQFFVKGLGINYQEPDISREVLEFNKEPNKQYLLNENGELWAFETKATYVGTIQKRPGYSYHVEGNKVVERKVLTLTLDEFYKKKNSGELKKLYRMGYDVQIKEDNLTLGELDKAYNEMLIKELEGRKIEKVEITRKQGTREFILYLDNGKRLVLREGLLVKGSEIELL